MAELVDAVDSKSTVERHIGSSPIEGTIHLVLETQTGNSFYLKNKTCSCIIVLYPKQFFEKMKNKKIKKQLDTILFFLFISILFIYGQAISYSCNNVKQPTTSKIELQNLIKQGQIQGYSKKTTDNLLVECFNIALEDPLFPTVSVTLSNGNKIRVFGPSFIPVKHIQGEDYEIFFKRKYNVQNFDKNIPEERKKMQQLYNIDIALADSICNYYDIDRDELKKIRQSTKLISKKKREINNLFDKCLEAINEKFVKGTKTTTINEDKLAELIAEKLIQKQNGQSVSTAPDCPSLI